MERTARRKRSMRLCWKVGPAPFELVEKYMWGDGRRNIMNYLWAEMIAVGILFGAFGGKMPEITNAALESAKMR